MENKPIKHLSEATTEDRVPGAVFVVDAPVMTKDTNPKDAIGMNKLPLDLVPDTLMLYASLAFAEGALKYGKFNWRVAGVRASIYIAAFKRHEAKYNNGEWADPETMVPHLASMIACLAIILDAKELGKLVDDRPPVAPMDRIITELEPIVLHLKELFKDHHPHQYTIADTPEEPRNSP